STGRLGWVLPCPRMPVNHPLPDLLSCKLRRPLVIPLAKLLFKKLSKGRSTGKSPAAQFECAIQGGPGVTVSTGDGTGSFCWVRTCTAAVVGNPAPDFLWR